MLRENLGSFLVFDWKSIKEIIPLWWILFRLIDSPWIIASFCSSYPYFLFFYSWDLGRSTMMDLKFATEPSVHSLDWINISCITVRCIWDISIVFMWCILNFAIFPRVWFDFKGFLVLRKRPPAPLALFNACRWRDSWRYGCRTMLFVWFNRHCSWRKERKYDKHTYFPILDGFVKCFEFCSTLSSPQNSMVLLWIHIYGFFRAIQWHRRNSSWSSFHWLGMSYLIRLIIVQGN